MRETMMMVVQVISLYLCIAFCSNDSNTFDTYNKRKMNDKAINYEIKNKSYFR